MGEVEVNWLAVVLATISSMVVGMIWYARPVFGTAWMRAVGLNEKDMNKSATKPILLALLMSFLTAYVLAHVSFLSNYFFNDSFLQNALQTAFWMWLGFEAAALVTHYSFERRSNKLVLLNLGNRFVTIMLMGLIIGLLKP